MPHLPYSSNLKEQRAKLSEKTNYILQGQAIFIKIRSQEIDFGLATIFNIVIPNLDNYSITLLIMYSNAETDYPVALTVRSSFEEDFEFFNPTYRCDNDESFENAIKEILSSDEVMIIVGALYSKASLLSRN